MAFPPVDQERRHERRHLWLVVVVTGLVLAALSFVLQTLRHGHAQRLDAHFEEEARRITAKIGWRMNAYTQVLRGGAGLFAASRDVTRQEWRRYVEALAIEQHLRGVQGVGFLRVIPAPKLDAHLEAVRQEGFPEYRVTPSGPRDPYTSIVYLEPFSGRNLRAFGYDMFTDPVRRAAMERARDSGDIAFSGKVRLVQETGADVQAGVLVYHPVYDHPADALRTVGQRRDALIGWTYSPYRMGDLMENMLRSDLGLIRLEIFDGVPGADNLLYDSESGGPRAGEAPTRAMVSTLPLPGRIWTLRYTALPGFAGATKFETPWVDALALLVIGLLTLSLGWALISTRRRARAMADRLTASLRESQEHLRATFEQAAVGISHLDPRTGRYCRVNHRLCELTGYSRDELEHLTYRDLSHPEDRDIGRDLRRDIDERVIEHAHYEKRYLHKGGRTLWVHVTVSAIFGAEGEVKFHLLVIEDITARKAAEAALRHSERKARELSDHLGEVIWATNIGTWEWNLGTGEAVLNERWAAILGLTREELAPTTGDTLLRFVHPDDAGHVHEQVRRCRSREVDLSECEVRMRHRQGHWVWVLMRGRVVAWSQEGQAVRISGTLTDISVRKAAEARLKLAASVFTHAREGIVITDPDGNMVDVNDTFVRLTGFRRDEVLGRNTRMLKSGRQGAEFYATLWRSLADKGHWSGEIWNRHKRGEVYAALLTISAVRDEQGATQNYVALFSDITTMKAHENALEQLANHDALTRLPNRVLLADRLRQDMAQAERRGTPLAVVFLDLDGFKGVNDRHGHDVGDELLIALAQRMKATLREGDTLARVGGDEFVALLGDLKQAGDCELILDRLLQAAAQPVMVGAIELRVTASLGVAFYPRDSADADELMRQADQAMYQAKQAGRNRYRFFEPEPALAE